MSVRTTARLACYGLLLTLAGIAQAQSAGDGDNTVAGSEEVDVNEESYRAFMELDDRDIQRNNFPVNPGPLNVPRSLTGLPESSQRHLREQLRDIIVGSGPWTPAEAERDYPYVPSAAAANDAGLRRREGEAWSELVDEYHAREAEIHASGQGQGGAASRELASGNDGTSGQGNLSGSEGASGQQDAAADAAGNNGGEAGQSASDTAQRSSSAAASTSSSGNASPEQDPDRQVPRSTRPPDEGVSQSALEFLTGQPAPPAPSPARSDSREAASGGNPRRSLTAEELERAAGLAPPAPIEPVEAPLDDNEPQD